MTDTMRKPVSPDDPESFPRYHDLLDGDRGQPPKHLLTQVEEDLGNDPVSKDRYLTQEWHDQERTHLWKRVWQMACRENDVPEVGDQLEYQIADQSIIIVRVAEDEIRAYHNSCLHRGMPLVNGCTQADTIQCGFHGWTWNLDGSLARVPCRWDFPEVRDESYGLRACKVGRWNGLVFVNLDPEAAPFEDYLGPEIPEQFATWSGYRTWKAVHVGKVLPCNWKLALEAFMETWHVFMVHPETMPYCADCAAQYDIYGPHARMLVPLGAPSAHLGPDVDPQAVVDAMLVGDGALLAAISDIVEDDGEAAEAAAEDRIPQLKAGQTPRELLADVMQVLIKARTGIDPSTLSDTEALDSMEYFIFPNIMPWGSFVYPAMYRFRPDGNDPESCIFEVMIMSVLPDGEPLPRDTPLRLIPTEQPLGDTELGSLGAILDQDMVNLCVIQKGIRSDGCDGLSFSNYQERNIRNFHRHLSSLVSM